MFRIQVLGLVASTLLAFVPALASADEEWTDPRHRECTVVGTAGDDVLRGTDRADVLCGSGGDDRINGLGGHDVLLGGDGNDSLNGGDGQDVMLGQAGDDRVSGGPGGDDLSGGEMNGGAGNDYCIGPLQRQCEQNMRDPRISAYGSRSGPTVNVTERSRVVEINAHLKDDLGVQAVQLALINGDLDGYERKYPLETSDETATLREGTPRDGSWRTPVRIPRYAAPGDYSILLRIQQRRGPETLLLADLGLRIRSDKPDTDTPELMKLMRPSVDAEVRQSGRLPVRLRVTDDLAGISWVAVCWSPLSEEIPGFCHRAGLLRGTRLDGVWDVSLPMRDTPLGDSELQINIVDRTGNRESWYGPSTVETHPCCHLPIPGGKGAFTVVD